MRPPASFPELLRSAVTRSGRVLCSAGNSPNAIPVASDSAAAKTTAAQFIPNISSALMSGGMSAEMPRRVQDAKSRLAMPPITASVTDSVSSCPSS